MRFVPLLSLFLSTLLGAFSVTASEGVVPFSQLAIHPTRSAAATALSLNDTVLSAQVQAAIAKYHVGVSQHVSKGDLLVSLDCAALDLAAQMAKARVSAAKAHLSLAQSQRERAIMLLNKALTSQEKADTRIAAALSQEAVVTELSAAFEWARLDVGHCKITAPFDGIITGRLAATGQFARVGAALLTMVDTNDMELTANVSYREAQLLVGVKAFVFDFGERLAVNLHNVGGVINAQTRNQDVRFVFADRKPLPGTAGTLMWADPRSFLPEKYIVTRNGQRGYFTLKGEVAEFVVIDGAIPGRPAAIFIAPETNVVVDGLGVLQHGQAL